MKPDQLRDLQAPLKARYREDPETAVVTMRASGDINSPDVVCRVDTGRALIEAGLHEAAGGNGLTACSGDMLLEALVACAGVTLRAVATALDIPLNFDLDTEASEAQLAQLMKLTERYCVVYQTLTNGPPIEVSRRTM